jgi:hypothetical protein
MSKKASKVKLAPHEIELVNAGQLENITHEGSKAVWLRANSSVLENDSHQKRVYRPMGDREATYLITYNQLPSTQPYQAIIEGDNGRTYAEKYLRGTKKVDSQPTTVIEFIAPTELIDNLFAIQHKVEDGALSMGLGNKAGGGITMFNESLAEGQTTYRIVLVKRSKNYTTP